MPCARGPHTHAHHRAPLNDTSREWCCAAACAPLPRRPSSSHTPSHTQHARTHSHKTPRTLLCLLMPRGGRRTRDASAAQSASLASIVGVGPPRTVCLPRPAHSKAAAALCRSVQRCHMRAHGPGTPCIESRCLPKEPTSAVLLPTGKVGARATRASTAAAAAAASRIRNAAAPPARAARATANRAPPREAARRRMRT